MAENREAIHILAESSGLTYEQIKVWLVHVSVNTPRSAEMTRDIIQRIRNRV